MRPIEDDPVGFVRYVQRLVREAEARDENREPKPADTQALRARVSEQWAQSCPVCVAELATVTLTTSEGKVQIGPKCSRILEQLARLAGMDPKRAPALKVLR